ncbi:hypothetical protein RvY_17104-2 [Ramazzottius varieornatus]|uniref:Uncharacterized protein n=1 Tax=Ramazzottius varieornatus TaxID=947166 RepID=A0A1D1W1G0_RAMVA|nr:hypothetical protein RvY_17104-2 [Ramazzottius varieornatus]
MFWLGAWSSKEIGGEVEHRDLRRNLLLLCNEGRIASGQGLVGSWLAYCHSYLSTGFLLRQRWRKKCTRKSTLPSRKTPCRSKWRGCRRSVRSRLQPSRISLPPFFKCPRSWLPDLAIARALPVSTTSTKHRPNPTWPTVRLPTPRRALQPRLHTSRNDPVTNLPPATARCPPIQLNE